MQADKPFPKENLDDPKRRAEHRVYRQLAESDWPGLFILEWKKNKKSSEVDFVVWLRDIGIFALQAKGGSYRHLWEDDEWQLRQGGRWERVPSPLGQTWSGADALINSLPKRGGYRSFVIPVLLFTDMEHNDAIERRSTRDRVHLLFMGDDLPQQLVALAAERQVYYPPTDESIAAEALAISEGRVVYEYVEAAEFDGDDRRSGFPEIDPDRVIIHHVEHLHQTLNLHLHFHKRISPEDTDLLRTLLRQDHGTRADR